MRKGLLIVLGGAVFLGLLSMLAQPGCQDRPVDPHQFAEHLRGPGIENLGRVSSVLYRGAQPSEEGLLHLRRMGVRTVVDLRKDRWESEEKACHEMGLGFVHIPLDPSDTPADGDIRRFLKVATDPMLQPVFVHCSLGKDRTGAFCSCYRMAVDGWPLDKAVMEMEDFGFHDSWKNLGEYVRSFPVRRVSVWP